MALGHQSSPYHGFLLVLRFDTHKRTQQKQRSVTHPNKDELIPPVICLQQLSVLH